MLLLLQKDMHINHHRILNSDSYMFILYQAKQRAGDRGIIAGTMENSQHTDINEDTTNENAGMACSNVRL